MFEKRVQLETKIPKDEIMNILSENSCYHSPVLNAKNINVSTTEKAFSGQLEKESFTVWETLTKKTVIVPVANGSVFDKGDIRSLDISVKMPCHNELMLKIWFIFLMLYILGNVWYIPFCFDKLRFLINIGSGLIVYFVSWISVKQIFIKRTKKITDKIGEMIKCL